MYKYLDVTGDLDLINLNRFKLTTDPKTRTAIFEIYHGDKLVVTLTKQAGEFFTTNSLKRFITGINAMKKFSRH